MKLTPSLMHHNAMLAFSTFVPDSASTPQTNNTGGMGAESPNMTT